MHNRYIFYLWENNWIKSKQTLTACTYKINKLNCRVYSYKNSNMICIGSSLNSGWFFPAWSIHFCKNIKQKFNVIINFIKRHWTKVEPGIAMRRPHSPQHLGNGHSGTIKSSSWREKDASLVVNAALCSTQHCNEAHSTHSLRTAAHRTLHSLVQLCGMSNQGTLSSGAEKGADLHSFTPACLSSSSI